MPKGAIFCSPYSEHLGEVSFELTAVYGSGGVDFPVLNVRTDIALRAYLPFGETAIQPLSLIRAEVELSSPEHRPVAHSHQDIALFAKDPRHHTSTQQLFSFPLDSRTLAKIEEARAAQDLRVQLAFRLLIGLHQASGQLLTFQSGNCQIVFVIPRSQWVDNLLSAFGYQGLEFFEIRYGNGIVARQQLPKAVQQIQQAEKHLLDGQWDGAVLACRQALELILLERPVAPPVSNRFPDKVNDFIRDHLSLQAPQAKMLADQIVFIWQSASQAIHPTGTIFKRPETEFLVRSTMAIIGFVSQSLS